MQIQDMPSKENVNSSIQNPGDKFITFLTLHMTHIDKNLTPI